MDNLQQLVGPAFVLLFFVLGLAFAIFSIVGTWKMFEKAGQPGWGILVPFYNAVLLVRIVGLQDWLFLLYFVPGVNVAAHIIVSLELGKRFEKGAGFTIGLIFMPAVFYALLGFDRSWHTPPPPPSQDDPLRAAKR